MDNNKQTDLVSFITRVMNRYEPRIASQSTAAEKTLRNS